MDQDRHARLEDFAQICRDLDSVAYDGKDVIAALNDRLGALYRSDKGAAS